MSILGASRARRETSGPRKMAASASGAPILKQRCTVFGLKGPAVETIPSIRESTSATASASARARSVGFTISGALCVPHEPWPLSRYHWPMMAYGKAHHWLSLA
jgi:hypothetical protein